MLFSEYITIFADAVGGLTQKTKHTMRCKPSTNTKLTLFIVLLLVIDQAVKFTVKLNMGLYQSIPVFGNWFIIHFIENPGAAFGMQLGGTWGKLLLSLIRIAAIVLIAWYLHRLVKKSAPTGVLVGGALILAGAIGNMIDSAFYGLIFSESTPYAAATFSGRRGIRTVPARQSSGYALFPHHQLHLARLDAADRRQGVHLFQSRIQHSRQLHHGSGILYHSLSTQIFP